MASFVENTQHKVERKAFEIMTNSIVGKLTKTDDIAKRQETFLELIDKAETFWGNGADKATLDMKHFSVEQRQSGQTVRSTTVIFHG